MIPSSQNVPECLPVTDKEERETDTDNDWVNKRTELKLWFDGCWGMVYVRFCNVCCSKH